MFKKKFSFILVLIICVSLTACGKSDNSRGDDDLKENSIEESNDVKEADNVTIPEKEENNCYEPERYETDQLTWEFDSNTGTLYIHGNGPMRQYIDDVPEWSKYKDEIITLILDEGITSVGPYAFAEFSNLNEVKMPDLNCFEIKSAMSMVAGTARSMGITVKGGTNPSELN